MLRYKVAYYLPVPPDKMVVAEVLDFPGAVTQGFDLRDARSMIASALGEMAQLYLEQGKPLPVPNERADDPKADLIERMPLSIEVAMSRS